MMGTRTITVSIRGFDQSPKALVAKIGVEPTLMIEKGESRRPGLPPLKKSVISFKTVVSENVLWDKVIDEALDRLGGVPNLEKILEEFSPEFIHVDIALPIRTSEEQEDGYVSSYVMEKLCKIKASLGFSFV